MKKKVITCVLAAFILISFGGSGKIEDTAANINNSFITKSNEDALINEKNKTVWTEVPIKEGFCQILPIYSEFNLNRVITEADYVFSGTVINRKEYEVQWLDDEGNQWGPYPSSVIEVKINKEYNGDSPVDGDTIRIYYPQSLSAIIENSFQINDNCEYVFVTRILDEEFVENKLSEAPDDKFEQEKHADVYISNSRDNIMPVDGDTVAVYYEYFSWNNESINKSISNKSIASDEMSSPELIESESFLEFDRTDFDNMFSDLFIYSKDLPN